MFNPLNTELNPICHLLALLETHHILHVSRVRLIFSFFVTKMFDTKCTKTEQLSNKQTNSTRHRSVQIPITNSALIYTQLSHHY